MTLAAKMDNQIADEIASARLNIVQSLYKKRLSEAMNAQIGKTFEVFLEEAEDKNGYYGRANNFYALKVLEGKAGCFAKVKATKVDRGALWGEVVG
jgi:tRNA A37 methylthiotransferase MiaB